MGTCLEDREIHREGDFLEILLLFWAWWHQVLWHQTCGSSLEEAEEERGKLVRGEYTPEGVHIKPHIVRGLDDWGGDRGIYNPRLVS